MSRLFTNYLNYLNINTMKKTIIIALAGIMMFAFTQCGGGVSGSKEYQDNMKMYKEVEKTIKNAKTCDELSAALMGMLFMGLADDNEYADAVDMIHKLYEIGVDALIIQDLHLLDFDLPPIALHASTQCDNRTPEHVTKLRDMGFRRVVLARELSIDEIRAIHKAVPDIELEAFVHGALCVSYSGRCYISDVCAVLPHGV